MQCQGLLVGGPLLGYVQHVAVAPTGSAQRSEIALLFRSQSRRLRMHSNF